MSEYIKILIEKDEKGLIKVKFYAPDWITFADFKQFLTQTELEIKNLLNKNK